MPLDPSFRSRLKDALRQSVVGKPASAASDFAGASAEEGETHNPNPPEGGSHVPSISSGDSAASRELRYEFEDAEPQRADERQEQWIADVLGGWWNRDAGGVCLVVDRQYAADRPHGNAEVGSYAETLGRYRHALSRFDAPLPSFDNTLFADLEENPAEAGSHSRDARSDVSDGRSDASHVGSGFSRISDHDSPFLFFDLETTGLSGGAGTCAFLIGYGWFEGGDFRTRQYFLAGYAHEPAMLRMAADRLGGVTLASFNGKTFDVPLITGRYLFHRVPSPFDAVPHVDLLHPARRLWRYRPSDGRAPEQGRDDAFARYLRATALREDYRRGRRYDLSASAASCALGALEDAVLGYRRTGDVPGAEIPTRYFHYVRTGDARPLAPVLEHNRLDLLSLAAVAALVGRMLEDGPTAARNSHECLALGRLYERSGAGDRAVACYERAVEGHGAPAWRDDPVVQREALRRLALRHRRERRYDEAAAAWQRLLDTSVAQPALDIEALQALAIHHEHRSRDLQAARALVLRALSGSIDPRLNQALQRRLARIERKIGPVGM